MSHIITSHIGSNPIAGELMTDGKMVVEFSPQGILAERIRAGGMGLPGILSDIATDNDIVQKGKSFCEIGEKRYMVETALTADISIVYAKKADTFGNLIFDKSARNTNPLCAMAGDITIAEVEEIVPVGNLQAEEIITPGVFVDYIIQSEGWTGNGHGNRHAKSYGQKSSSGNQIWHGGESRHRDPLIST